MTHHQQYIKINVELWTASLYLNINTKDSRNITANGTNHQMRMLQMWIKGFIQINLKSLNLIDLYRG